MMDPAFQNLFFSTKASMGDAPHTPTTMVISNPHKPPNAIHETEEEISDGDGEMGGLEFLTSDLNVRRPVQSTESLPAPENPPSKHLAWKRGELVGRGSFGSVYKCLDLNTGRLMADKEFLFVGDNIESQISMAERELSVMEGLDHINIVRYIGFRRHGMSLEAFQEFISGGTLAKMIQQFGAFPERLVQNYTGQLLSGLKYLHDRRIVHRDIKSANCLITGDGIVKLADFGCSRTLETVMSQRDGCATLCGTPHYMAPEVIKQQRNVGRRSDIWSLGCLVVEMSTGKPPFSDIRNATAIMYRIASTSEMPPLPTEMSSELVSFIHACFTRDPQARPTATQLLGHPFIHKQYPELDT
eukprot:gnl/Trimastix_PCT/2434.p1 GENE.gnl/Trimastix_PCT/2434~~gnl/Trimastix_PCT/2434.p1  ORF type:complete len:357 (-),score=94.12 gnl/Trimastix_PCT/2434:148-1218(-)